jgi:hypothetical protein
MSTSSELMSARVKLGFLIIFGIALIGGPNIWHAETGLEVWGRDVIRDIGIAVFSAALLGLTVEWWMRKDFADDVFRASVGYILPQELREQINWITGHKFMATRTSCTIDVSIVGCGIVKITSEIDRKIKNITSVAQKHEVSKKVDDWGRGDFRSEILECVLTLPEQEILRYSSVEVGSRGMKAKIGKIEVPAQGSVRTFTKTVEYKATNDALMLTFAVPSVKPEIHLTVTPELNYWCEFGAHGEEWKIRRGLKALIGTLMPNQYIRVRWWPKRTAIVKTPDE